MRVIRDHSGADIRVCFNRGKNCVSVSPRGDLARKKNFGRRRNDDGDAAETKLLTLLRIKATSRLRDCTRNTETSCIQRARRMHRCTRIR